MRLSDIINNIGVTSHSGSLEKEITSIHTDSRKCCAGSLFIAVKGAENDGHKYIGAAIANGAEAVVCATVPQDAAENVTFITVEQDRKAAALVARNFYGNPSGNLKLVGVTGTNGKTSIATLLYHTFTKLGYCCGLLSTIANYVGSKRYETENTTPGPVELNALLNDMTLAGCEYCFMEVSSIGVEQERVEGLKFKVGIFSNLTHDHLDYHKTFAEYLRCKKLFFDRLPSDAIAVTNVDDRNGMVMVQNTKAKVVTYSLRSIADHTCRIIEQSFEGMLLRLDSRESWSPLIGQHNAYNLLAIYTTAMVLGAEEEEALIALSSLRPAPGRLENMRGPKDISVIIDYAHTPDALENVLKTLREISHERELICLFGCGGDRDKTKRPEMAQVAQKLADRIIVTSDNSRTEKTSDIMGDIKSGMDTSGRAKSLFIEDREEAIRTALMIAGQGATILLAGKGHETYQIIGTEKRHFDEKEIVARIFEEMN